MVLKGSNKEALHVVCHQSNMPAAFYSYTVIVVDAAFGCSDTLSALVFQSIETY